MTPRMVRRPVRGLVLAAAVLAAGAGSWVRAAPQQPQFVSGRVVSADATPRALPNARVEVAGGNAEPVFTNGEGLFSVAAPPRSTLRVTKAGFAPATFVAAGAPGDVQISLVRGAVVSGVVVDELGFPVNEVRVRVQPVGASAGATTGLFAETDEAGTYRIGSLPPGRYTVNSEPPLPLVAHPGYQDAGGEIEMRLREAQLVRERSGEKPLSDVVSVDLRAGEETHLVLTHRRRAVIPPDAPIAGAVAGSVRDEFAEPLEGIAVRLWRVRFSGSRSVAEPTVLVRRTDDRGQYRLPYVPPGRYLLVATDEQNTVAPAYFPGTTSAANAAPFVVGRNEQVSGIDITFTRVREARVTGIALAPNGAPLRGSVTLAVSQRSGAIVLPARLVPTDERGAFEFQNVPPGEYVLRATAPAGGSMRMQPLQAFGAQYVTVNGAGIPPVTIATSATATVAGRLVFEGNRTDTPARGFLVTAVPDADLGAVGRWMYEGRATDDGTFAIPNVAGLMRLSVLTPPGWWVKSIDMAGADGLRDFVRFGGPDDSRTGVTIVVASGGAAIGGRVNDAAGRPADDYRVVVFSTESRNWFERSPHVRLAAGPEGDGGFVVRDLPPGDYWAVAVDAIGGDADIGEWQDPDVLLRLSSLATRVSLAQDERATVRLTTHRWSR